jgi:hypothetical protein
VYHREAFTALRSPRALKGKVADFEGAVVRNFVDDRDAIQSLLRGDYIIEVCVTAVYEGIAACRKILGKRGGVVTSTWIQRRLCGCDRDLEVERSVVMDRWTAGRDVKTGLRTVLVGVAWMQPQADLTRLPPILERLDHAAQLPVQATAFLTKGAGVTGARTTRRAGTSTVVVTVTVEVAIG